MKTLYLIDGHAQFFRAYHAIRTPMTSPVTKEPTNATFGFVGMLLKLLRTQRPDYLAMVIDVSGDQETFRSELYPEYKAHRDPPPENLHPQVERCVSLVQAMGAPVLGVAGVEADDVIATLAERLADVHEDLKIRIVSKDKDLQQLLRPGRIEMYDVHTDEVIDVERLQAEKHITPEQVIDFLALMGDNVDNVPGVEGVGPKTAAQLIEQYGTLDNLLAHADEIKGKRGERLREAAKWLPLSRQLVTLKRDVPVELTLDQSDVAALHLDKLAPIFRELGFNRYVEELKQLAVEPGSPSGASGAAAAEDHGFRDSLFAPPPAERTDCDYKCIRTKKELEALVKTLRKADCVAVDTETTGLSAMQCRLCGISISIEPSTGWYVPIRSPEPKSHLDEETVLEGLRSILEDPSIPKCGHNLKYDILVLRRHGVRLRGVDFDSMVASYVIDASRSSHSMNALALALLGHTCIPITDLIGSGKSQRTFDTVPLEDAVAYAAEDADISLRLRNIMAPQIKAMKLESLFSDVEMPLVDVLAELEWNGILIDPDELDRQAKRLTKRIEELRKQINDAAPRPFNPDSPRQLAAILFNKPSDADAPGLGIKPLKRTKTGYSTDIEVLEKLADDPEVETEAPRLIVEYRQLTKLVSTYLVALKDAINPDTKRIHASFNQTVAATGRLSSSDPNLQNIPIRSEIGREIRRAFVAPEGRVFISADYSQIELRILAHLSRDPALIEAFEQGADIHRAVAAQINNVKPDDVTRQQRDAAKMVNFGIVYGITAFGLARRLGIGDKEAAVIIDDYKKRFAGITTFLQECVAQAQRYGYVETILKRRRPIPQIEANNPQQRSLGERMAINSVVQGSAADLIKLAMINLHRDLTAAEPPDGVPKKLLPHLRGTQMLLQIHDELLFEAPAAHAEPLRDHIVDRMQSAMTLSVPLLVESAIASNWAEGK